MTVVEEGSVVTTELLQELLDEFKAAKSVRIEVGGIVATFYVDGNSVLVANFVKGED